MLTPRQWLTEKEQGLLPFHFAAMWDASLDVIYYLLKHCPDALVEYSNAIAAVNDVLRSGRASSSYETSRPAKIPVRTPATSESTSESTSTSCLDDESAWAVVKKRRWKGRQCKVESSEAISGNLLERNRFWEKK
jgi:hypothetical protein